ncbi:MAG: hypothetical protein JNL82_36435 [Myxococcales bacterium]|nr:hypothetical protein [Myxococcales bacterium]
MLVLYSLISAGLGFIGGVMFTHDEKPAAPRGRAFFTGVRGTFGEECFLDGPAIEDLMARADETAIHEAWTGLRFGERWVHVKLYSPRPIFPGQRGAVYLLRRLYSQSDEAQDDVFSWHLILTLIKLGRLENGGHWNTWEHAFRALGQKEHHGV